MMQFETESHKKCYEKVAVWMKELFGEQVMVRDDVPALGVIVGSALVQVSVFPWGDDDATIMARSWVVSGADITPDLQKYLLEKNTVMRFGAFGVDAEGDICFDHTIVGNTCDKVELKTSVLAVATTADRQDDEITSRWGGQRATDRLL